jgi:two-component system response regulator RegA
LIVLTGFGSIATALEAVRLGATHYVTKPADADQVLAALRRNGLKDKNAKTVPTETPSLDRVEWEHIQRVLAETGGNISHAARLLGLDRRSLQRKLAKFPPSR